MKFFLVLAAFAALVIGSMAQNQLGDQWIYDADNQLTQKSEETNNVLVVDNIQKDEGIKQLPSILPVEADHQDIEKIQEIEKPKEQEKRRHGRGGNEGNFGEQRRQRDEMMDRQSRVEEMDRRRPGEHREHPPHPNHPRKGSPEFWRRQENNDLRREESGFDSESESVIYEHEKDEVEEGRDHKRRHWRQKGMAIGKGMCFIILGIISLALISKCIKRKKKEAKKRMEEFKMLHNPAKIDEKISHHYQEIQKLEQMKIRAANVQRITESPSQYPIQQRYDSRSSNPIIYHQAYSQQLGGTLYNENFQMRHHSPAQFAQDVEMSESTHYPQIPMGRPVGNNNNVNGRNPFRN